MKTRKVNKFLVGYAIAVLALGILAYIFSSSFHSDGQPALGLGGHYMSDIAYVDLPRVSLNVASKGDRGGQLCMDISLEVEKQYANRLQGYVPHITEKLANFARGLDYDSISRPQGVTIIRQYLLEQANQASTPVPIMNVVFREYLLI